MGGKYYPRLQGRLLILCWPMCFVACQAEQYFLVLIWYWLVLTCSQLAGWTEEEF